MHQPSSDAAVAAGPVPADAVGFAEWVRPYLSAMARLAARLAPAADRDDVVQETLVRAWLKRRQYDPGRGSLAAWLLAITADQARKARVRSRPTAELTDDRRVAGNDPPVPASPAAGPVAGLDAASADRVDLTRALDRLTGRQRLAVDCVYYVGLTVAETAAVMRCAEGTVKSTLADARARLRNLLEVSE